MRMSLNVSKACIVLDRFVTVYLDVVGVDESMKVVFRGYGSLQQAREFLSNAGIKSFMEINIKDGSERQVMV